MRNSFTFFLIGRKHRLCLRNHVNGFEKGFEKESKQVQKRFIILYRMLCKRFDVVLFKHRKCHISGQTPSYVSFVGHLVGQSLNNARRDEYGKSFGVTDPPCHALFLRMIPGSSPSLSEKTEKSRLFFFSPATWKRKISFVLEACFIWLLRLICLYKHLERRDEGRVPLVVRRV